jgi:hypothetical protein
MRALLLALVAVTVLAGCGNKERERGSVRVRGGDEAAPGGTTTPGGNTVVPGAAFKNLFGNITGFQTNSVKALVSATMDPETDMILPISGIAFNGDMRLSTSSQDIRALGSGSAEIVSGAELAVFILDKMTTEQGAKAITIGFKPGINGYAVSGRVGGGTFNVTFHDQYGDIMLTGQYNTNNINSDLTGQISFKNSVGAAANQTIQLGTFKVPTCGFFHCQ